MDSRPTLSRRELATLRALADALIPPGGDFRLGAADVDAGRRLSRYLQAFPSSTHRQLRALLAACELLPLASRAQGRLSHLAPAARRAWAERAHGRRLLWEDLPLRVMRALCLSAFCSDPQVERALGYARDCLDHRPARPGPRLAPICYPAISGTVEEHAEVCVVGSGAGGAVVARELAEAGLDVVVVEEGAYFTREAFAGPPFERLLRLYRRAGMTVALGRPLIPVPLGQCVGGTTVVNSGTCFRAPARVLRSWEEEHGVEGVGAEAMRRHFERVEQTIGVREVPAELLGRNAEVFARGAAALGYHGAPIRRNIEGCRGCGQCAFGCPSDAKQAMQLSYLPLACARGARLYARCRVGRIVTDGGRAAGVEATILEPESDVPRGKLRVRCPVVVLAAGAIHTPHLLARNRLSRSRHLGRHLRLHPAVGVAARFAEKILAWQGTLQPYFVDDLQESHGVMIEVTNPVPGLSAALLPGVGARLKEGLAALGHLATAGLFVSDTSEGRVISLPGRAEPLILYRLGAADARNLLHGIVSVGEILLAAGARAVYTGLPGLGYLESPRELARLREGTFGPTDLAPTGFHPAGTCRMGADPERAVVDGFGRVHGLRGLYVADASVFPSCVGVNPQLSIMALAARTAEHLRTVVAPQLLRWGPGGSRSCGRGGRERPRPHGSQRPQTLKRKRIMSPSRTT